MSDQHTTGRMGLLILLMLLLTVTGCSVKQESTEHRSPEGTEALPPEGTEAFPQEGTEVLPPEGTEALPTEKTEALPPPETESLPEGVSIKDSDKTSSEPAVTETDWSEVFEGINGAAVIYAPAGNRYQIYNEALAGTRRSPCSTFKIVSSLIALENGLIDEKDSVLEWSGEKFWNDDWNRDIGFQDAFRTSCVWYFRKIIDEAGKEMIQTELDRLSYGNRDISDWEGRLNTNNQNRALTGFWIESSLKISAREQAEVMERIFGSSTSYKEETLQRLKAVMLVPEEHETDCRIYGKTGMGKLGGIVVDAWFAGFAENEFAENQEETVYFCVYLGETEGKNVSSTKAKEIAQTLVRNYFAGQ